MKKTVNIQPINGEHSIKTIYLNLPNKCPHCETAISVTPSSSFYIPNKYNPSLLTIGSVFFCPYCEQFFFAEILVPNVPYQEEASAFAIYPPSRSTTTFSEGISKLSPRFVEIFNQAEVAESNNLYEICGSGYRRALEFLVKDFIINQNPDHEDNVKKEKLGDCISNYIDNLHIKSLAKASAWIGNDETHYVRKHEDYGLKEMKIFVMAMVSYIDTELSVQAANDLISQSR